MKRVQMSLSQVREEQRDVFGDEVDNMGIMALVDVENMGWCRDGCTRWYHFTKRDGQPAVYYKH